METFNSILDDFKFDLDFKFRLLDDTQVSIE